jgi:hypothetical protein
MVRRLTHRDGVRATGDSCLSLSDARPCLRGAEPQLRLIHIDPERVYAVTMLTDPGEREVINEFCRARASCSCWDRSAELLAGGRLEDMGYDAWRRPRQERRDAPTDIAVVAGSRHPEAVHLRAARRCTDEIVDDGERASVVLGSCHEADAWAVLWRIGALGGSLGLARRQDLLVGPGRARSGDAHHQDEHFTITGTV